MRVPIIHWLKCPYRLLSFLRYALCSHNVEVTSSGLHIAANISEIKITVQDVDLTKQTSGSTSLLHTVPSDLKDLICVGVTFYLVYG